ncbi:MAG: hypothetical protein WC829_02705 [Hyphomicrobium sp.]|jgi:hypothetical protein
MDVRGIVAGYLKANGFDGLVNIENDGCGCCFPDLEPCGQMELDCQPAYKHPCKRKNCPGCKAECERPLDVSEMWLMKTAKREEG